MKKFLNISGFSLMELIFALSLSTMIGYVIFMSARAGDEQSNSREARMTLHDNAREGLYKMVQEIRQSAPSRITIPMDGTSISFQVPNPGSLVNEDYTLNWNSSQTIQYSLVADQIIRTNTTTGTTAVVANNVTSITFTGDSAQPNRVTIALNVQKTLTNGRLMPATPLAMTGQAEIRNT